MNTYTHQFAVKCPNNRHRIAYTLKIETMSTIMVEDIVEECAGFDTGYHEHIADRLHSRFGGVQKITAHHHGVDIVSCRSWTPSRFADRCREIVENESGHQAHRSLDLLTNDVLRHLGFDEGINIFEQRVANWHQADHAYPHQGPCPDCERSR